MPDGDEIFSAKSHLLGELGWTENPFVKDLRFYDKESFLKYYYPFEGAQLLQKLAFDTKVLLLQGPKGVGKTSALYYVYYSLPASDYDAVFFKEPPATLDDLATQSGFNPKSGVLGSLKALFGGKSEPITRAKLAEKLRAHAAIEGRPVDFDVELPVAVGVGGAQLHVNADVLQGEAHLDDGLAWATVTRGDRRDDV